jgi:isocitrate dehydrogenase (NAD+)
MHQITRIEGDGIGPEVMAAVCRILDAAGVKIEWEDVAAGTGALAKTGTPLPDSVIASIRRTKVALKGPIGTPIGEGFKSVNVGIRKALDLYACVRPISGLAGVPAPFPDLDFVLIRENTESLYAGLEKEISPGVVHGIKLVTRDASLRIARYAFEFAKRKGRKRVTVVHKANIMKLSDGLFLRCAREVAADHPSIPLVEMIVDNCAMQLVTRPKQFDVIVTDNLYGDILSDLAAGLIGGLGVAPGANIGESAAVFEATHGTAPDIAGQNKANPAGLLRSAILMLEHLGEAAAATRIDRALRVVIAKVEYRTGDLGGRAATTQFTDAICRELG